MVAVVNARGTQPHFASLLDAMREGEPCGDAAACFTMPGVAGSAADLLVIVDGLGHGAEAALAAATALQIIGASVQEQPALPLPALLELLERGLTGTRGAAIGLARVQGLQLQYAGIGNTRALCWRGERLLRLSSRYGIVGGGLPLHVEVMEMALQAGDWLLLYTDGIEEMLKLPLRLPEWQREPALLCQHLLAHWRAPRDDAGVLVYGVAA
jgi:serine/threonine protein phosphatase PrpC